MSAQPLPTSVSENRYQRLFDASREGLLLLEVRTRRVSSVNPALVGLLGLSKSELLGKALGDIGISAEQLAEDQLISELTAGRSVQLDKLAVKTRAGFCVSVAFTAEPFEAGGERYAECTFRDLSAEHSVTAQLGSGEYYRSLIAAAPMAMFACDHNAVIQHYNARAEELWGRAPVCGVEKHCGSIALWLEDGTRLPHEQSPMLSVLSTGEAVHNVEVYIERPDGSRLPVLANFAALSSPDGAITGTITSFVDITEGKRVEAVLRDTQHSLSTSLEQLKTADRRKNEFLAMLAHELRNPLAPIRNAVQVLQLTGGEPVQAVAKMMERQVGQIVRMVDDLLDVSRISLGKIELRRERVGLAPVVHQAVEAAQSLIQCLEHKLSVSLSAEPIFVDGDPSRLVQILGNLLNNACKFTKQGGDIAVVVERVGSNALIRVRDSGIGIAPEQLPHVFDLFMQVDNSLERAVSGLGIGLTLVKNLVEMHGGSVQVQSDGEGLGSEFLIRLPILEVPAPVTNPASSLQSRTAHTRRVLVVDDNRDAATSLSMVLELSGFETQIAYDGLQAVATAEAFLPDVLLLDIGLPKLNGYEVARHVRAEAWGASMLLIALTGWGQLEDRKKSKAAGFDLHLVKPVDIDELMKLLSELPATVVL